MFILTNDEANELIRLGQPVEVYKKNYDNLVMKCKSRGLDKSKISFYTEKHHIIPKCMGGEDKDENYVLFSALEHIIAHILLWKVYEDNMGLCLAAFFMTSLDCKNRNIPEHISLEINDIVKSIDVSIISSIKESSWVTRFNPIVCWDKDFLGNPIIFKTYNFPSEVKIIEGGKNWKIINEMIDDDIMHIGYYWSTFKKFNERFPNILDKYLSNPNKDKLPYRGGKYYHLDPIVCIHPETGDILKIYRPYSELLLDGFGITACKTACENSKIHVGYRWSYLSKLQETPDGIEFIKKYISLGINNTSPSPKEGRTTSKSILIYDPNTLEVLKIYSPALESRKDGFDSARLVKKAREKENGGNNCYNGHYVSFTSSWEYPEKLNKYKESSINNSIKDSIRILKCDINNDIISIYENRTYIDIPGNKNKLSSKIDTGKYHLGFLWYHPAKYKELFPAKWIRYEQTNLLIGNPLLNSKQILKVNTNNDIIKTTYYEYLDRAKASDKQTINYQGEEWWILSKYVQLYPDKWNEYLSKQNNLQV